MSFFVMPLCMHRSGPDNRDLIGGAYNSDCHVALRPRATRHELVDMSQGREAIIPIIWA